MGMKMDDQPDNKTARCSKVLAGCWPVKGLGGQCDLCEGKQQRRLEVASCTESDIKKATQCLIFLGHMSLSTRQFREARKFAATALALMVRCSDGGMTLEEYRASYSIYAVLASPIIISADLRTIATEHPDCLAMLKNKELLAVHQDALAKPGALLRQRTNSSSGNTTRTTDIVEQVFSRELAPPAAGCAARAVGMFNRAEAPTNMTVTWAELGRPASGAPYSIRDVWANNEYG